MVRKRIEFVGRVQGVGFRARTERIARDWPVTGWVRNEDDGSVSMEVQGDSEPVAGFLDAVRTEMGRLIVRESESRLTPVSGEAAFSIRR